MNDRPQQAVIRRKGEESYCSPGYRLPETRLRRDHLDGISATYSPDKAPSIRTCQEKTMATAPYLPAKDPEKVPDSSLEDPDYNEPIEDPDSGKLPEDVPDEGEDDDIPDNEPLKTW
jgi:hypothetical protein